MALLEIPLTTNSRRALLLLGCLNFFFVTSYSTVGVHALFLHQYEAFSGLREATVLGMALFSGTQVGGVWLLSLIRESLTRSSPLLWGLRLTAAGLLCVPTPGTVVLGLLFFGLSHSIFYVRSRALLAKTVERYPEITSQGYALLGMTTNLSFLSMPIIGGYILSLCYGKAVAIALSVSTAAISLVLLECLECEAVRNGAAKEPRKRFGTSDPLGVSQRSWHYVTDVARFLGFILPYAVMMAIIPLRFSAAGWSARSNSYMIAANGVVVTLFQVFYFMRGKKAFQLATYDRVSLLTLFLLGASLFSPIQILIPLFLIWCFCEAYQLPAIEYHLFSRRQYSGRLLHQMLAIDALMCFVGPLIAEHATFSRLSAITHYFVTANQ